MTHGRTASIELPQHVPWEADCAAHSTLRQALPSRPCVYLKDPHISHSKPWRNDAAEAPSRSGAERCGLLAEAVKALRVALPDERDSKPLELWSLVGEITFENVLLFSPCVNVGFCEHFNKTSRASLGTPWSRYDADDNKSQEKSQKIPSQDLRFYRKFQVHVPINQSGVAVYYLLDFGDVTVSGGELLLQTNRTFAWHPYEWAAFRSNGLILTQILRLAKLITYCHV